MSSVNWDDQSSWATEGLLALNCGHFHYFGWDWDHIALSPIWTHLLSILLTNDTSLEATFKKWIASPTPWANAPNLAKGLVCSLTGENLSVNPSRKSCLAPQDELHGPLTGHYSLFCSCAWFSLQRKHAFAMRKHECGHGVPVALPGWLELFSFAFQTTNPTWAFLTSWKSQNVLKSSTCRDQQHFLLEALPCEPTLEKGCTLTCEGVWLHMTVPHQVGMSTLAEAISGL